tara:strand:- start:304 stop:573 length:270 start_codon:yes stop_codon:yes gene_type:complete
LRAQGKHAEVLSGGFCAWGKKGLPVVQLQTLPKQHGQGGVWVTRHRLKIDQIACPWLLRRSIDPHEQILFATRLKFWPKPINSAPSHLI